MKKWMRYILISVLIVAVFIGLGYVTYTATGNTFPTKSFSIGEIVTYKGIGFTVDKFYPEVRAGDPEGGSNFYVDVVSVISYVLVFTGTQWLIAVLINKLKKNKNAAN